MNNLLNFYRQVIEDAAVTAYQKYVVDWDNFNPAHLSSTQHTTTQEYDALNRIRKALYPEDLNAQRAVLLPTYNKAGALRTLKLGATDYVEEIAYTCPERSRRDARGQRILMVMNNSIMTRYVYHAQTFRLARMRSEKCSQSGLTYTSTGGVQQDLAYGYDLEGTITAMNDRAPYNNNAQGPGNQLREFTHDPLRRLLSATGRESSNVYQQPSWDLNIRPQDRTATNDYTRSYAYDKLGNIQTLNHVATGKANQDFVRTYNYASSANNHLSSFSVSSNSFTNTYDANGNLTKEGTTRYLVWGHNDKPVIFYNRVGQATPTVFTHYFYNAAGDRVKKLTRKGQKLEVTVYACPERSRRVDGGIFELTYTKPTGTSIDADRHYNTLYLKDGNSIIASGRVGTNVDDGTPAIKYTIDDHLGNSTVLLNSNGNLVNREEYYPFGETAFGAYAFKRYRFNGKEKDEESGLYNYGQRYYAPWLCRFVSVDPIAEKFADLSSYNYAGNKPITKVDQEGLQEKGRKESPQKGESGKKGTKDNGQEGKSETPVNIAPIPEEVQAEIDAAIADALANGNNIEITVDQTEEGYSVSYNTWPSDGPSEPGEAGLTMQQDPEFAIRDQKLELEKSNETSSSESSSPRGPIMEPMAPQPAKPLNSTDSSNDAWKLVQTITEGYVDKTENLMKKGGEQLAKAAKFFKAVGRVLGSISLLTTILEEGEGIKNNGFTWKNAAKLGGAVVLFGAGLAAVPGVAVVALLYGIADYTGLIDRSLDGLDNFFKEVKEKTVRGYMDTKNAIEKGIHPYYW